MQSVVSTTPPAAQSSSDSLAVSVALAYTSRPHEALLNTSQTSSVEANNAEVRHYLARLDRRSRCFSRSLHALHYAIKLFAFAWNRRQLAKRAWPRYAYHLADFLYP